METSHRIVDVTDMTPAAFDAFLSVARGEDFVDASDLTREERCSIAVALGWPNDCRSHDWVVGGPDKAPWIDNNKPRMGRTERF